MRTLLGFLLTFSFAQGTTYYIAPSSPGNDSNSCAAAQSSSTPKLTFTGLFSCGVAGDTYVLLDGTYSAAGSINNLFPNGTAGAYTTIKAQNEGNVVVTTVTAIGTASVTKSYFKIQGITFVTDASTFIIRHSDHFILKNNGFRTTANWNAVALGIGDGQDTWPSTTYSLVEDCWVWGMSRVIAITYWSQYTTWRRVVVRGDGCNDQAGCTTVGYPNVGITVYGTRYASMQNIIVVDRILNGGYPYADFAQAFHDSGSGSHGDVEWLGCLSINSEDNAVVMDPDSAQGSMTIKNFVAWNAYSGITVDNSGTWDIQNVTLKANGAAYAYDTVYIGSALTATFRNSVITGTDGTGYNSYTTPSYVDMNGTWLNTAYLNAACSIGCKTTNPYSDGTPASIKYPIRIETGSVLKGTGYNGADYGANIVYRYGTDGTFYGGTNYNTLGATNLWPWPNEARIRKELCADSSITRGFCTSTSLTYYIMNQLGNGNPYPSASTYPSSQATGSVSITGTTIWN